MGILKQLLKDDKIVWKENSINPNFKLWYLLVIF